jgi:hypothetical protein
MIASFFIIANNESRCRYLQEDVVIRNFFIIANESRCRYLQGDVVISLYVLFSGSFNHLLNLKSMKHISKLIAV